MTKEKQIETLQMALIEIGEIPILAKYAKPMADAIEKAKAVGLQLVRELETGGKQEGASTDC